MSDLIARMGEKINHEESVYYWCWKNNIPVFCPAVTDGAVGDTLYYDTFRKAGLVIDIFKDLRKINDLALNAKKLGVIVLGGGVGKHHVMKAATYHGGADFSVIVNTAEEFDGSDSGARPDEAKSQGKIKKDATPVKVFSEASIIWPILCGATFATHEDLARKV